MDRRVLGYGRVPAYNAIMGMMVPASSSVQIIAGWRSWKPIQTPTKLEAISPTPIKATKMRIGMERLRRGAGGVAGAAAVAEVGAVVAVEVDGTDAELAAGVDAEAGVTVVDGMAGAPKGPGIR
jgi:hypothetical protein